MCLAHKIYTSTEKAEVRLHTILSSKYVEISFTLRTAAKIGMGGAVKRKSKFERGGTAIINRNMQSGKSYVLLPVRIQTNVRHVYSWTSAGNARAQTRAAVFRKMKHHFTVNVLKEMYGRLRLNLIFQTSAVAIWAKLTELSNLPHSVFMCFVWISEQTENISLYCIKPFKAYCSRDAPPVPHSTTVRSAHTVFMCFVFIWENRATCATHSINWLVFIAEMKSVYSAVRSWSLNKAFCASSLKG